MIVRIILCEHANADAVQADGVLSFFNSKPECRKTTVSYKPVYRNDSIYDVHYLFMRLNVEKLQKHVTSAGS